MPITVDEVVQDAKVLREAIENHKGELGARGFDDKRIAKFDASLAEVLKKDSAQKSTNSVLLQRTEQQNKAMVKAAAMISKTQNAAKSAFGNDRVKLKEFKVGTKKPGTVKKMTTMLEYFTGVAVKYTADLVSNGMLQEDIVDVSNVYAELVAVDAVQENSKKLRNAATKLRNDAVRVLKAEVFKARKFAEATFGGNKAALEEFKPIARTGRRTTTEKSVPLAATAQK